jgi:omega-amidase
MKPRDIHVAAIQSMLHWEDRDANLKHFERMIEQLESPADLLVLPEMFTTGFTMRAEKLGEPMDGPTLAWMQRKAAKTKAVVTGSFIVEEKGSYFNRLLWVRPDGSYEYYNKRHLFRMAGEDKHFSAGDKKLIVELNGWKVCPLVCYDLRFPVWSRNRWTSEGNSLVADYDLLLYVANWPERRAHAWKTLLMARAMENLCYVVGLNRIGNDGHFTFHAGESAIIDFKGEIVKSAIFAKEEIISSNLSAQLLEEFRKSFPAGMDADPFRTEN